MKQHIYVRGALFATVDREPIAWLEGLGGWPVTSTLHVCPNCQTVWAELLFEELNAWLAREGIVQFRRIEEAICEFCGGGSLLTNHSTCNGTDWGLLEAMPEDLLIRELDIHIKQEFRKCEQLSSGTHVATTLSSTLLSTATTATSMEL